MYNPTMRLLTILELLQSRGEISGQELAHKLEVDERSIRRYIMMLRDWGIPIDAERGRHGGYALRPGFRLPPLMFNKDEITAVMLGLMTLQEYSTDANLAVESAIAKIQRVLPDELRQAAQALHRSVILDDINGGLEGLTDNTLSLFSTAADNGQCVQIQYYARSGEGTERTIAPYGVVLHGGKCYIPAYCYLRQAVRVFRMDRVQAGYLTQERFNKPVDFDARAYVLESLARAGGTQVFEVLFDAPLSTMREIIPPSVAILEESGQQTLMRCYSDDGHWLARHLALVAVPYKVLQTDGLRHALRSLVEDMLESLNDHQGEDTPSP